MVCPLSLIDRPSLSSLSHFRLSHAVPPSPVAPRRRTRARPPPRPHLCTIQPYALMWDVLRTRTCYPSTRAHPLPDSPCGGTRHQTLRCARQAASCMHPFARVTVCTSRSALACAAAAPAPRRVRWRRAARPPVRCCTHRLHSSAPQRRQRAARWVARRGAERCTASRATRAAHKSPVHSGPA